MRVVAHKILRPASLVGIVEPQSRLVGVATHLIRMLGWRMAISLAAAWLVGKAVPMIRRLVVLVFVVSIKANGIVNVFHDSIWSFAIVA